MTFEEWWAKQPVNHLMDEDVKFWAREAWVESKRHTVFKQLRKVSVKRSKEHYKTHDSGGVTYHGFAAVGELGELFNLLKKLERVRLGGPDGGHTITAADITTEMLEDEAGGFMTYFDLVLSFGNIDLEGAVARTFNRVSEEIGSPHRIVLDLDEYEEGQDDK